MTGRPNNVRPPIVRFMKYVSVDDAGHWLWTGALSPAGYAQFRVRTGYNQYRLEFAHRWSYEQHIGLIPDGLTIDHLCRLPACVNPSHLEPVTNQENVRRAAEARRAVRTECPRGHAFTPENRSPDLSRCNVCLWERRNGLHGVPDHAPHGSRSTYGNYGCRCEPCVTANAAACAAYNAKRRAQPQPLRVAA